MDQDDRDRLKTIEIGILNIDKAINGERGIVARMDNHGKRIKYIEGIVMVGGAALASTGIVLVYAKDIVIGWAKKKMLGGS